MPKTSTNSVAPYVNQESVKGYGKKYSGYSSMSRKVMRDDVREKNREVHNTYQDTEDTELDMVRSKNFNFYNIQSIILS